MTINSEIRKVGPFIGNGTASAFPFTFKVFQASDLEVVKLEVSTNVETVLVLSSQYTVTLNSDQDSNPGGTVTLIGGALASGYTLTLTSDVPYLQPTDLTNQGGFYPDVINDSLDRATIQIQQQGVEINRSFRLPISSTANVELPNPSANELLGWDSTGQNLTNIDPSTLVTVVAYATAYADVFIGDGTTTSYVLTRPAGSLYNLDVSIQGVTQEPTRDYTLSGTTITFTTAPFDTHRVLVKYKEGLPNYNDDTPVAPSFLNSWANAGGDTKPLGYFKDNLGYVHVSGVVVQAAIGLINTTIFQLPAGFRTATNNVFDVACVTQSGAIAGVRVYADGYVTQISGSTAPFTMNFSFKP